MARIRPSLSCASAAPVGSRDEPQHGIAVVGVDHGGEKPAGASCAFGPSSDSARAMRTVCSPASFIASVSPLARDIEQTLAAVVRALLLHHIALVDELLEHATERLLGDLEDVEQLRDLHARIAVDEMQHAVVGAAEAELRQHVVGIADEVAIGEEQQLDDVPDGLLPGARSSPERPIGCNRDS
jgi:hypothetical protein